MTHRHPTGPEVIAMLKATFGGIYDRHFWCLLQTAANDNVKDEATPCAP
jgi:hypothetical protein